MNTEYSPSETFFEFQSKVPLHQEEMWSWFCFENGALGVETLEDDETGRTLRIFFESCPKGGAESLKALFEEQYSNSSAIQILEENIRQNENWQLNWREHFKPVEVGKSLLVLPAWEKDFDLQKRQPIWIDPGQGFGTGHHASTALALEMLEVFLLQTENLPMKMIDVGIGSGILAIAACRLGVQKVEGVDIETEAVLEVQQNAELNEMGSQIQAYTGQPALISNPAPLVISNMLLRELLEVHDELARLTSKGGSLICSGLWENQDQELIQVMTESELSVSQIKKKEGWKAIRFVKKQ